MNSVCLLLEIRLCCFSLRQTRTRIHLSPLFAFTRRTELRAPCTSTSPALPQTRHTRRSNHSIRSRPTVFQSYPILSYPTRADLIRSDPTLRLPNSLFASVTYSTTTYGLTCTRCRDFINFQPYRKYRRMFAIQDKERTGCFPSQSRKKGKVWSSRNALESSRRALLEAVRFEAV